jgi:hypothetical protein
LDKRGVQGVFSRFPRTLAEYFFEDEHEYDDEDDFRSSQ